MPSAPHTTAGHALRSLIAIPLCALALAAPAQLRSQTLQQQYDKAQSLQSSGDMEQAAFAYRLFLASALSELGEDHARSGDSREAAKRYEAAYALRPSDAKLLASTASAERDAGNLARARELVALSRRACSEGASTPRTPCDSGSNGVRANAGRFLRQGS